MLHISYILATSSVDYLLSFPIPYGKATAQVGKIQHMHATHYTQRQASQPSLADESQRWELPSTEINGLLSERIQFYTIGMLKALGGLAAEDNPIASC